MDRARIPFGIQGLDQEYAGIPRGSFVLLSGEVDSGVDEYAYTSTAMINTARHDPGRFRRYNDADVSPDDLPSETYYITLERDADLVREKMAAVLNSDRYDALVENTTFVDFSEEYLDSMPVLSNTKSDSWDGGEYRNLLRKLRKYLNQNADDSVVVIDSITSLFKATEFGLGRANVLSFLTYLTDASRDWNGLVYGLNHTRAGDLRKDGELASTPDGVLYFKIGELGGGLHRAMYMGSFRGTFSDSQDTIRVYEVKIDGRGFEVSTVNEII